MGEAFSLDTLRKAMAPIGSIPPAPFFASMSLLPRDHAVRFTKGDRKYLGAHPDFWRKIPAADRGMCQSAFAIEIVDLDLPCNHQHKIEFFAAMADAFFPSPPTTEGEGK